MSVFFLWTRLAVWDNFFGIFSLWRLEKSCARTLEIWILNVGSLRGEHPISPVSENRKQVREQVNFIFVQVSVLLCCKLHALAFILEQNCNAVAFPCTSVLICSWISLESKMTRRAKTPRLVCDIPNLGYGYERKRASCLYIIVEFKLNSQSCQLAAE